jgi:hypothetical protein
MVSSLQSVRRLAPHGYLVAKLLSFALSHIALSLEGGARALGAGHSPPGSLLMWREIIFTLFRAFITGGLKPH